MNRLYHDFISDKINSDNNFEYYQKITDDRICKLEQQVKQLINEKKQQDFRKSRVWLKVLVIANALAYIIMIMSLILSK